MSIWDREKSLHDLKFSDLCYLKNKIFTWKALDILSIVKSFSAPQSKTTSLSCDQYSSTSEEGKTVSEASNIHGVRDGGEGGSAKSQEKLWHLEL